MKIKELPKVDRPREKLASYGPNKLSNVELLAILLGSGTKKKNVVELSKLILRKFGKKNSLANATVDDLQEIAGLGPTKSGQIVACFELSRRLLKDKKSVLMLSPQAVWEEMKDVRDNKKEHLIIFFLDTHNQQIQRTTISVGTLTTTLAHPREVFEPAIRVSAAHVIVAHNHPSGDTTPSSDDRAVTKRLVEAGKILGIEVLDHVIVTKEKFFGMRENGLLIG